MGIPGRCSDGCALIRKRDTRYGVHPFDPYRDLKPVTELISVAFAGRLDSAGELALAQMRRVARTSLFVRWLYQPMWSEKGVVPGFVWVEDGRVVGNVSLRRALDRGGFFIGNVSVHPDWRRRGIAGALMEAALEEISACGGRWVGLEVRTSDSVARRLYERLGFEEVGRTLHMFCPAGKSQVGDPPSSRLSLRRGRGRDSGDLIGLVRASVPESLRPLLELPEENYRLGWEHTLDCWLKGKCEAWWVAEHRSEICGAVRVLRERGWRPNRMEVLVGNEYTGHLEIPLVQRGVASLRGASPRMIETVLLATAEALVAALEAAGFHKSHELIQMRLDLRRRSPVRTIDRR